MISRFGLASILVVALLPAMATPPAAAQPFIDISAGLTGVRECSLAWADYDKDGDLDLAIAGTVSASPFAIASRIYRNEGNDTFTDISAGLAGVMTCSLAWGDYDKDGYLDLALAGETDPNNSAPVSIIYRNEDDGVGGRRFTDINAGLIGVRNCSLAWGDYNKDGYLDLAIAGLFDELEDPVTKIYRNEDDGEGGRQFTDVNAGVIGMERCSVAWGDYDKNGYPDLAIAGVANGTATTSSRIYRNEDDGLGGRRFTDIGADLAGVMWCSLAWGDYNNDTYPDLALAGRDVNLTPVTKVYRNADDGAGGRQFIDISAPLTGVRNCSLTWGDLHNDGERDLAVAGIDAGGLRRTKIYRYEASDMFVEIRAELARVSHCSLAWGDYDADNDVDLAVAGTAEAGFVSKVYRNDGLCGDANGDDDSDGVDNCKDNCVSIPNGAALGTCIAGVLGTCAEDADCDSAPGSADGACSANQEDADGDRVGDACDNCPWDPNGPDDFDNQTDFDDDGVGFACDLCPHTPPGTVVDPANGCIPIAADFNHDGIVDEEDLDTLQGCASGPAVPLAPGCETPDLDFDGDVDHSDFGLFQRCIVYDNNEANPQCADGP